MPKANTEDPDQRPFVYWKSIGVPTSSGNHGKSLKKFHAWKNYGILKILNNHGKIMEFCEII